MTDTSKRRTLKWFGAAPLTAIPFASMAGMSNDLDPQQLDLPPAVQRKSELQIQIIDTSSVPDNSVLMFNAGTEQLLINQFITGTVIFNNRMLDLNSMTTAAPIVLEPGQTKSFDAEVFSVLAVPPVEYVYADHAAEILNAETSVIRLGAFMFDDMAVVYADPAKIVPS